MSFENGAAPMPDPIAPTSAGAEAPAMPTPAVAPAQRYGLEVDGEGWIAYASGAGSYGTGHLGLAPVSAIHFARADRPEQPLLEALLGAGCLPDLFEAELLALFRDARAIVKLEPGAAPRPRQFGLEG